MTEAGWFVARGTGVMALILLSVVVVLGVGSRSGRPVFGLPRFAVSLVHRNAALLAIGLLTVHIVTLLFDPYAKLRVFDLFVPFGAEYRPIYLGLGTIASDVMLVLVVTSLLRRRIGVRLWRTIHWLAYASWPAAFGHAVGTGTDSGESWMWAVSAACLLAVLGALVWRLVLWIRPRARRSPRRSTVVTGGAAARSTTGVVEEETTVVGSPPDDASRHWPYGSPARTATPSGGYAAVPSNGYAAAASPIDMYRRPTPYQPEPSYQGHRRQGDDELSYSRHGRAEPGYGAQIHPDARWGGYPEPGVVDDEYGRSGYPDHGGEADRRDPAWTDPAYRDPAWTDAPGDAGYQWHGWADGGGYGEGSETVSTGWRR
ncbi:ferric reductase-like transmembrane domain-containing protein [Solwaraspora sp. WMMD406]|uniref:ferric reductase-like transmembrane domain-containing protein n=1 Tax=Solwaraspora sp. WMMD406 TaxID=3016095 RepID=UPI002416461A|nr:ferric reductase-like transmembrane domain-containing protein [Solwaraspora sp. WMMD406]MDG4766728.1 ferric reductase-like transmembrane domain-containing protein [Solwaraspora sp. WMMD406]